MNIISKLVSVALIFVSMQSFATVGGKQHIEFIGYDVKDQKIYLLKHDEDSSDRLPQLYYFMLSSKNNSLIAVRSMYKKTTNYAQDETHFKKQLAKIKQRLQPLTPVATEQFKLHSIQRQQPYVDDLYYPDGKETQYHYVYSVEMGDLASSKQQAVGYRPGLKIDQAYLIPKQKKAVVSIQYWGLPEEGGYTIDDAVILTPKNE